MATYNTANNIDISTKAQSIFASRISPLDDYIAFATDTNTYVFVLGDYKNGNFENSTIYTITRVTSGTNTYYTLTEKQEQTTTVNVSNRYYTYSNISDIGGTALSNPANSSYVVIIIGVILFFWVLKSLFKGVLQWRKR